MFIKKEHRKLDKEILSKAKYYEEKDDDIIIDVKFENNEQIFSSYNYDNKKTLNKDLCDYLWENAKLTSPEKDLIINVYNNANASETEIESAIKNHYRREYKSSKADLEKINIFTLGCFIVGILFLITIVISNNLLNNYYINILLEIAAWVFIWEAVDKFFLERPQARLKCLQIQRLYSADIRIKK